MMVVMFLLALAMIATGATAVFFGAPIIQLERGWAMVISGSGVASAGAVLLGIGVAAQRMGRLEREIRRLGDRFSRAGGPAVSPPPVASALPTDSALTTASEAAPARVLPDAPRPEPDDVTSRAEILPPGADEPLPNSLSESASVPGAPDPGPDASVVGRYASGGNSYVMYSDGSIHADTPTGRHRFRSLDELKSFVAAGGERGERPGH